MMKLKRTQDLTNQGEGICVAAVSEAKEETGVSKPGYGSSVACCGEGKYSLLLLVSIVCLPSSYFDALKFCFCVDGFIWSRLLVLMLGYQNGISGMFMVCECKFCWTRRTTSSSTSPSSHDHSLSGNSSHPYKHEVLCLIVVLIDMPRYIYNKKAGIVHQGINQ
ncbi:hypothetical protein QL285_088520 [Trifolium repens]|nr:hypothetical protein QL285_088520 [Trifolium repens]